MSDWFQETALSGSMVLALPVALAAGLISFFSPCVIPLLPGYLSYATGIAGGDLDQARRGRMVLGATLFVLGFSVVFVLLGSLTGAAGAWLFTHTRQLNVVRVRFEYRVRHRDLSWMNKQLARVSKPVDTFARAKVIKIGRRIANVQAEAWQGERGQPIAAMHGHFLVEDGQ